MSGARRLVRRLAPLAAAAAAGAGTVVLVTGDDDLARSPSAQPPRWQAPDRSFSVALPAGWRAQASGRAATVLASADRTAVVVVRSRPPVAGSLERLSRGVRAQVRRDLPGARSAGVRRFDAGGRDALLTTFVRGSRVHAVAVVPAGPRRAWSLDAVASGGRATAARDVARVLRSFRGTGS